MKLVTERMRGLPLIAGWVVASAMMSLAAPALANSVQQTWRDADSATSAGQLDVPLNKSQMLTVDQPVGRIMVGNSEIADILPITGRSIYVLGKQIGTTSLTVFDKSDSVIAVIDVAVGPDIVSLRRQIGELLPGEKIGASISNDAIVLTGVASSAPAVDRAVQLAKTYAGDKVVNMVALGASQQVLLEVRFSEVQRDTVKQLGLGAFLSSQSGRFDGVFGQGSRLVPDGPSGAGVMQRSPITDTFGVFRQLFDIGGVSIEGTLDALENKGLVKTLAQPTLIALSGETASFLAGGEFPIPVVQQGSASGNGAQITVEFKPFGVSLAFTPTVLADGVISLSVEPEVSAIDHASSVQINGLSIPGLRTRRASTVLELRDGEAFAIAGLMQKDFGTNVRQIPILGSIPIIGTLFRSTGFQRGDTELVIVVIPRLVKPVKPEQISLPTSRVRDPREGDLFLLGRTDQAVPVVAEPEEDNPSSWGPASGKERANGYEF